MSHFTVVGVECDERGVDDVRVLGIYTNKEEANEYRTLLGMLGIQFSTSELYVIPSNIDEIPRELQSLLPSTHRRSCGTDDAISLAEDVRKSAELRQQTANRRLRDFITHTMLTYSPMITKPTCTSLANDFINANFYNEALFDRKQLVTLSESLIDSGYRLPKPTALEPERNTGAEIEAL